MSNLLFFNVCREGIYLHVLNVQDFCRRYETYLYKKLQELGIPFQTENALRKAGFSKTPDVKLEVPIGVQGRVVNWIDSKASFGDEYTHKNQAEQQFQR